jgi:prepilin-type N-terminal cleavage/methylation domain-containing protein
MKNRGGFTIIEVLVAVLILTVGVLGLAGTAAAVTRLITQGQIYSEATALATERIEILRSMACDHMTASSETRGRYTVTWSFRDVGVDGRARQVKVDVQSPRPGDTPRTDTFSTTIGCQRGL